MKEGWSVKAVSPSHGGARGGLGVGAALSSLSPPRGEDEVIGCFAPVAHFRRGPSCGQNRRGACRSKGLAAGEHVPDRLREPARGVDLADAGAALAAEAGARALVPLAEGGVAAGVRGRLDQRPAQVLGALLGERAAAVAVARLGDARAESALAG